MFQNKILFKCALTILIVLLSPMVFGQSTLQPKPYIVVSGPSNLAEVRVNVENYGPNGKTFNRSEITFGDGTAISTEKDVYHTYPVAGQYQVLVKTWNSLNVQTTYSEIVYINPAYFIQEVPNSSVLNLPKMQVGRLYNFPLFPERAAKLYKLTLKKTQALSQPRRNGSCGSSSFKINNISIFKSAEFGCNVIQFSRFVLLSTANTVQLSSTDNIGSSFEAEIHEVILLKDVTKPILSASISSGTVTKSDKIHVSVADESSVTTYISGGGITAPITDKEFDLPLVEGTNNYIIYSIDSDNNRSDNLVLANIIRDSMPPIINALLASEYFYTTYPQTFTITFNSNEDLQGLTVNNFSAVMVSPKVFQYLLTVNQPGALELNVKGFDLAGNESIYIYNPIFNVENTPPVISSSLTNNAITNQRVFQVTIVDNSETTSEVFINNQLILSTSEKSFSASLNAGANNVLIKSKDIYNNEALSLSFMITVDETGPLLADNIQPSFFVNSMPDSINLKFTSNELLQKLEVDNQSAALQGQEYVFSKTILQEGIHSISVSATDLAGNTTTRTYSFNVILDTSYPLISFSVADNVFTIENSLPLVISIDDATSVLTEVFVNQVLVGTSGEKIFSYLLLLPIDGTFVVTAKSTDLAGNQTSKNIYVSKDVRPLSLDIQSPQPGSIFSSQLIEVRFSTNKAIKRAFVNSIEVPVNGDLKSVSFNYSHWSDGPFDLIIRVEDQYGAVVERSVRAEIKLGVADSWAYSECPVE